MNDMNAFERLGERIRTERIAQGYSVKRAAAESGIARDTWRKIEAGGSVHDTKRHIAMSFLGISEANTEWGSVGKLEDHAADLSGMVDLNLMFSQAVRFTATVGIMVPQVRDEAERVSAALSDLFLHGLELWDRKLPEDRETEDDLAFEIHGSEGGDGNDAAAGSTASTSQDDYGLIAHDEEHDIEDEQQD